MNGLSHFKYIDALRGFAFLGVLTVHASQNVQALHDRGLTSTGMFGVQLFFLLSAVTLMRSISLRSSRERFPTRNFFVRRFFRIAPLFWFGIALYFLLNGCGPQYFAPNGLEAWQFICTALFLHAWTPTSINSVVPGGWSIGVEMTFYLCLPFLASRASNLGSALSLAFYTLIVSAILNLILAPVITHLVPQNEASLVGLFLFYWFPSQLPVFLLGIAVYYCLNHEPLVRYLSEGSRSALLMLGSVYALVALSEVNTGPLIPSHVCYAAVFAIIIIALKARPFALFVNPLTCGLGTISYSCYITHFAVLKVTAYFLTADRFAFLPHPLSAPIQFLAVWVTALILTSAVSTLTYFAIEKPGINLGTRIIRHFEASGREVETVTTCV